MPEQVLLSSEDIRRALQRIAHEIVESNRGVTDVVLVGILTRGAPLAHRIGEAIRSIDGEEVPVGVVDISFYRDDLPRRGVGLSVAPSHIPVDITDKRVVLIDDVIFTGRSIRAALDALVDFGRPRRIQLAVLVDRGHRELPIRPDFVGKNLPTSRGDDIQVRLTETDGRDEVAVVSQREE